MPKLINIAYEINHKKNMQGYELPVPILILYTLDESQDHKEIGFGSTTPTIENRIELESTNIEYIGNLIDNMIYELRVEEQKLFKKVKMENTRKIIITLQIDENTGGFNEFENELLNLLAKYNFKGIINNFSTGNNISFPQSKKNYKV